MKLIHAVRRAGWALLVVTSIQAYAQSNDVAPAADANPQGSASQYKTDRSANYALGRKVRSALSRTMGLAASHVIVRSENGAVTLQGAVPKQADSEKAAEIARSVPGVVSVTNALSTRPEGT